MRLCRFRHEGVVLAGLYEDDHVIGLDQASESFGAATGFPFPLCTGGDDLLNLAPPDGPGFRFAAELAGWLAKQPESRRRALAIPLSEVELLVPIASPPKLLLLAGNYAKHVEERGYLTAEQAETFPYVFSKPPSTTLTNPFDPIVLPEVSPDRIDWECELGVVIGRRCRRVSESEALDYVAGYTVVNDISDRQFTPNPGRKPRERDKFFDWLHGKWHDSSCPIGPCLLTADVVPDPQNFTLRLEVNGQVKQDASTAQMVFPVAAVIAFISQFVTLEPGDIISTGTPAGVGSARGEYLRPGDVVRATIAGIGTLENPVETEAD